jgi:hypothetical protein
MPDQKVLTTLFKNFQEFLKTVTKAIDLLEGLLLILESVTKEWLKSDSKNAKGETLFPNTSQELY